MNKQQLASKIWAAANDMRSKIEASEYKDYILGFIFYKFLSEQEEKYFEKEGATEEEIKELEEYSEEAKSVQKNIGYFISYKNLFSTWIKKGNDFNIADVRDALSAFDRLINPTHKKVFDGIFKTLETGLSKLGTDSNSQTKAVKDLINLIKIIPMDDKQDYDVLGFIYEYLISNFAANAGKKAGEFYTPHEVSILMSEIIANHLKDKEEIKIYDPTSGSGSLLINIGQCVAKHINDKNKIKYYAQELKENTYNLTRMNLVMRGILPDNIVTRCGDTLEDDWPYFDDNNKEETYEALTDLDAVVSNPPYSQKWDPSGKKEDPRFKPYGYAPKSKADYAFLLHDLYHLSSNGIMTIVLPHGVLFRGKKDDDSEGEIRKNLIESNNIDAIIGLPANIFFGTGIPTIIMVLKKKRENDDVLIIDASKGFIKEGKNNKLRARDIKKIVDVYEKRADINKFSRKVSRDEIRKNDYNLNIPRYVDSSENAESIDVYATMFGGIPSKEIEDKCINEFAVFDNLKEELFTTSETSYVSLKTDDYKKTIDLNSKVIDFKATFADSFKEFDKFLGKELIDNMENLPIAKTEVTIADDIFNRMENVPLVDEYEAYQILDNNWKTISSDLEMIQTEGLEAINKVDPVMVTKKKDNKEIEVQDGWKGHIIPFSIIEKVYLEEELKKEREIEGKISDIQTKYDEYIEKIPEDDKSGDFLNEDNTAFVTKEVTKIAKEFKKGKTPEEGSVEEILVEVNKLIDEEKALNKEIKALRVDIDNKCKEKIESLTFDEQRNLLKVKWILPIIEELNAIPESVISNLKTKVSVLSKKYETTMVDLDSEIESTEKELSAMLDELTGDDFDMKGLQEFKKLLGGDEDEQK